MLPVPLTKVHVKPVSIRQVDEQPSASTVFPSSQVSVPSILRSPQTGMNTQSVPSHEYPAAHMQVVPLNYLPTLHEVQVVLVVTQVRQEVLSQGKARE